MMFAKVQMERLTMNMKRLFRNSLIVFLVLALNAAVVGDGIDNSQLVREISSIEIFFDDFVNAYNNHDIERVKLLAGKTAPHWIRWIKGPERMGEVKIVECTTNGTLNVTAKMSVLGGKDELRTFDAVFKMRMIDGSYCIEEMSLPESDGKNLQMIASARTSERLIKCINNGDLIGVKGVLEYDDNADFEIELANRGLIWIKQAIDDRVKILSKGMAIQRMANGELEGCVSVPCAPNGTNIIRKVIIDGEKVCRGVQ